MDFWFEKSTPANTIKKDALETSMKLTVGVIHHVWLVHPAGCHGLAYASIFEGGHQLFPTNPDKAYHGDTFPMEFDEYYKLKAPAELTLKTWNLDDTYAHSVYVRISILPEEEVTPLKAIKDLAKMFGRLLGVG